MESNANVGHREPWNKGKIVGQKAPFKLKDSDHLPIMSSNRSKAIAVVRVEQSSALAAAQGVRRAQLPPAHWPRFCRASWRVLQGGAAERQGRGRADRPAGAG